MSGFGFAAMLTAMLRPPSWRRLEAELDRRDSTLLRFGLMLAVETALFLAVTVHVAWTVAPG